MIARAVLYILPLILLSDVYIDAVFLHRRYPSLSWKRLLWWLPTVFLTIYTCWLASLKDFLPVEHEWLYVYLLLLGVIVGSKVLFSIFSGIGLIMKRFCFHHLPNFGNYLGVLAALCSSCLYVYGFVWGFAEVRVKHLELSFSDLPVSFSGYKIVHVSDLHLGTFNGWRKKILSAEMDSIKKQNADLILFTGDLQNARPEEITPFVPILSEAMPQTIAVLGNHDYAEYINRTPKEEKETEQRLINIVRNELKWKLLNNQKVAIYPHNKSLKGNLDIAEGNNTDSIIICGMENSGKPPFPNKGNVKQTMKDVSPNSFVIMLQHDPWAWRNIVLPHTSAQLTLSGHTHGGQMQFFGFRPTQLKISEDYGLFSEQERLLYVTAGLGGLFPMRINMPNEITVITLRRRS